MCDKTSVIPSGPLVVPPPALLLLTSVERAVIVMVTTAKVALSLLVAEASALTPSEVPAVLVVREVSAVVLLTGRPVPVHVRGS